MGARFSIRLKSVFILSVSFCSLKAMHQGSAAPKPALLPSIWHELHKEHAKSVDIKKREQCSTLCGRVLPALRIIALSPENNENRSGSTKVVKKEPSIRNEEELSQRPPFVVRPAALSQRGECVTSPREYLLKDPERPSAPEQDMRHSLEGIDGWFSSSFKTCSRGIVPYRPRPAKVLSSQVRLPSLRVERERP